MSKILLCNQALSLNYAGLMCGINTSFVHGLNCSQPNILSHYAPYALNPTPSALDKHLIASLSDPNFARELTNTSLSFGEDNTMALAEILKNIQEHNISAAGASTSIYANRVDGFVGAVKEYQQSLMDYRAAVKAQVKSRRGTPLTSATRATNIAKISRHIAKLNVSSQAEANNIVKFSQTAKFLFGGRAVIDAGSRVGSVHNSYVADENGERELFIESLSFVADTTVGTLAVNIGGGVLGFLVVATPVGWVGLIVGGLAVAGVAGTASIAMDSYIGKEAGDYYDTIQDWLGQK